MTNKELKKEWEARVAAFLASGQSTKEWCAAQNLKINQLRYWLRKLKPADTPIKPQFSKSHNGFWLYYRRLERGVFQWPSEPDFTPVKISYRQLRWLLDGLPLEQEQAHQEVTARTIL